MLCGVIVIMIFSNITKYRTLIKAHFFIVFSRLSWSSLVDPVVVLARDGFHVTKSIGRLEKIAQKL